MTAAHTIGLDFGTLSVRAAVVRVDDGEVVADAVREYATPVMERALASRARPIPPATPARCRGPSWSPWGKRCGAPWRTRGWTPPT